MWPAEDFEVARQHCQLKILMGLYFRAIDNITRILKIIVNPFTAILEISAAALLIHTSVIQVDKMDTRIH